MECRAPAETSVYCETTIFHPFYVLFFNLQTKVFSKNDQLAAAMFVQPLSLNLSLNTWSRIGAMCDVIAPSHF